MRHMSGCEQRSNAAYTHSDYRCIHLQVSSNKGACGNKIESNAHKYDLGHQK